MLGLLLITKPVPSFQDVITVVRRLFKLRCEMCGGRTAFNFTQLNLCHSIPRSPTSVQLHSTGMQLNHPAILICLRECVYYFMPDYSCDRKLQSEINKKSKQVNKYVLKYETKLQDLRGPTPLRIKTG